MDVSAYRLLYDNIHDFKTTARLVESEIKRHGIRDDSQDPVPTMKGRIHHDMWVSMKTVSHFNLAIALESLLKLLLFLNKVPLPREHLLVSLHDKLPAKCRTQLEATYQATNAGYELIAYVNVPSPTTPVDKPPARDISSLRGFFEYFDEDMVLWQKRYSWELVEQQRHRHYVSDLSVFIAFIGRVMGDIERF
ncbi:MAG: hypothetical protein OXH52_08240 [Gammaproteobacteria bacterium]|nr:hypothetical protein [Gammaproteobacteria bacterium]